MFLVFVDFFLIYLFIYLFYFFTKGNIKLGTLIPITKPVIFLSFVVNSFNSATLYWSACSKRGKWLVMYSCVVLSIVSVSTIWFWNCSTVWYYYFFHFIFLSYLTFILSLILCAIFLVSSENLRKFLLLDLQLCPVSPRVEARESALSVSRGCYVLMWNV